MTAESFYWYASVGIFAPWLLLLVAPRWKHTEPVAFGAAILLILAAAFFTFRNLASAGASQFFSFQGMAGLFRSEEMLLTGWLNYLSFCLLVGIWQVHDARLEKIPHLTVLPSLLLTLLAGPTGLLLYLLLRFFKTRRWEIR